MDGVEKPEVRPGAVVLLALSLLLAFSFSLDFFVKPLTPWPDQSWVLESAQRLAAGKGLTTSMGELDDDISVVRYHHMNYFPPAYPVAVAALLRCGMPTETAVKAINLLTMVAGLWGWVLFSVAVIRGPLLRCLFVVLLVTACGAIVPLGGTADYILWALLPWWMRLLLDGASESRWPPLAGAGVVAALAIGVRWAAAFLVPAAGIVVLLFHVRHWRRGLFLACFSCAPPVLAYAAISLVNRTYGGGGSYLSYVKPRWDWGALVTPYPLVAAFSLPTGIDALVLRLWRTVDPAMQGNVLRMVLTVAVPSLLLLLLLSFIDSSSFSRSEPRTGPTLLVAGVTWAVLLGFLGWMAVRYNWANTNWTYLAEPRYFRPLLPAALVAWLALLPSLRPAARRAAVAVLLVTSAYLLQASARNVIRELRTTDERWEVVRQVRGLAEGRALNVVFDVRVDDYVLQANDALIVHGYPDPRKAPAMFTSRPATVWLVRRTREKDAYSFDPDAFEKLFRGTLARFPARRVWSSSGGAYELYRTTVQPGRGPSG